MAAVPPAVKDLPKAPKVPPDEMLTAEYFQALREFTELLPGDDGEPLDDRERIQINLCIDSANQHWADRSDFFAGGVGATPGR